MQHLVKAKWEDESIDQAVTIVHDLYDRQTDRRRFTHLLEISPYVPSSFPLPLTATNMLTLCLGLVQNNSSTIDDLDLDALAEDEDGAEVHQSPLDSFIRGKPVFEETAHRGRQRVDSLRWWLNQVGTDLDRSNVRQMALDVLSAPGESKEDWALGLTGLRANISICRRLFSSVID